MPDRPSIFISYRIADALDHAIKLSLSLELAFGKGTVFFDKSELQGGEEWAKELESGVQSAQIVLVLIANVREWLGVKTDDFGGVTRRIDSPTDWVRRESELALAQGKKIIPILVGEAKLPPAEKLPETLRRLPELQGHKIPDLEFWGERMATLVQIITETIKGNANPNALPIAIGTDPLAKAILALGIDKDNGISAVHLVNCDRIAPAKIFRKNFNRRAQSTDFQFYFIGGCPTEMPASFCKRAIWDIVRDRLDGKLDAIDFPFQEDADRIRIENLPLGTDLPTSQKRLREYFARRFKFSDAQQFDTFIATGLPRLPFDFVTAVFEISEKNWDGDEGEIRQYFEWLFDAFRCPNPEVPTFLFFIVVKSHKLYELAAQTARQKTILAELTELCEKHAEQATLLSDFPPFDETDFADWVADLDGIRNPNNARAVTRALAAKFEANSEESALAQSGKFHAKDIEEVQRKIYDQAVK